MDRPPPPSFGPGSFAPGEDPLDGLGRPEDEVFGAAGAFEDEYVPRTGLVSRLLAPVHDIRDALAARAAAREHQRELEELQASAPAHQAVAIDPELEGLMIRLPSRQAFDEILAAESQESLFQAYSRERDAAVSASSWGMALAALVLVIAAALGGVGWLAGVSAQDAPVSEIIGARLSAHDARLAEGTLGLLGIIFSFGLLTGGFRRLIEAWQRRSAGRAVPGAVMAAGGLVMLNLAGPGHAAEVLIAGVLFWAGAKAASAAFKRMGGR